MSLNERRTTHAWLALCCALWANACADESASVGGRDAAMVDASTTDAATDGGVGDANVASDASMVDADGAPDASHSMDASMVDANVAPDAGHAMDAALDGDDDDGGEAEAFVQGVTVSSFFATHCADCHGYAREGNVGPALLPSRLTGAPMFYQDTIANGRPNTPMMGWSILLSAQEIAALVDFILTEPR